MVDSVITILKQQMEVKEGFGVGLNEDQKRFLYPLVVNVIKSEKFGGVSSTKEEHYTQRAFHVGRAMNGKFGGIWSCICGEITNDQLDFSFSLSAVRFQSVIVLRKHFFYVGQIYDPLAPLLNNQKSEWNLN
jgi:hypothetical protein